METTTEPMSYVERVILDGYFEAMFFTEEEELQSEGFGELGFFDILPHRIAETIATIRHLLDFGQKVAESMELDRTEEIEVFSYLESEQFGHDIWLGRNGHGAGIWDNVELPPEWRDAMDAEICKLREIEEPGWYYFPSPEGV
jgi:hypothetical protein